MLVRVGGGGHRTSPHCRGPGLGWGPIRCTCCSSRSPARSAARPPTTRWGGARTGWGAYRLQLLFALVAGRVGGSAADDAVGVFCCGLRVVSMDGSSTDVPDTKDNDEYFGRPSNATRAGAFPQVRWVVAA